MTDETGHAGASMGAWIARLRASMKMNQATFAVEIGVSPATLARWETNKMKPSPLARKLLALLARKQKFPDPMPD